jgi:hypothetical protein
MKLYSACINLTLRVWVTLERVESVDSTFDRVEITLVRVGITFVPVEITLRVEITFERVQIKLVRVQITLVRVQITLELVEIKLVIRVKITIVCRKHTLRVKSHSACCNCWFFFLLFWGGGSYNPHYCPRKKNLSSILCFCLKLEPRLFTQLFRDFVDDTEFVDICYWFGNFSSLRTPHP